MTALKRVALVALLLGCAPLLAEEKAPERPDHPGQLKFGPLEFEIPRTTRHELPNGLVVHLLENHELPLITVTAWVRAGAKYDPADKTGLSALTGAVMRAGGTKTNPADALDEKLDRIAAAAGTSIQAEHAECGLNVLKKNFDQGLALFAEILREPAFPDEVLGRFRQQALAAYQQRNSDPGGIADRIFGRTVYGDHPYAREATPATLNAIKREDLVDMHARTFLPNNTILGVAGDFDSKEMLKKLAAAFGSWGKGEVSLPEVPPVAPYGKAGLFIADKERLTQSSIRIGHLGVRRNTIERVEADLMNLILGGGGFGSRLNTAVRVKAGLTYSIYSHFSRAEDLGTWVTAVDTKTASTWHAVGLILDEIEKIRNEPVTAEELQSAKDMILNGFVFGFEDPASVVDSAVSLEYYGYPEDWLDRYLEVVRNITVERIHEVAKARLTPEKLAIVVVGVSEELGDRPERLPEPVAVPLD